MIRFAVFVMATAPVSLMVLMDLFGVLRAFRRPVHDFFHFTDLAILRWLGLHG
jgi:hypothetical protein